MSRSAVILLSMVSPVRHRFIEKCLNVLERRAGDNAVTGCNAHATFRPIKRVYQKTDFRTHVVRRAFLEDMLNIKSIPRRLHGVSKNKPHQPTIR